MAKVKPLKMQGDGGYHPFAMDGSAEKLTRTSELSIFVELSIDSNLWYHI
jgi:hypothetical protein